MDFALRLSSLMKETQTIDQELADYVGVSRQSIYRWRNGSMPAADKAAKIAEYFGVDLEYFGIASPKTDAEYQVPIVGSIRAGYPIESFDDHQGYVNSDYKNDGNLFALRVVGDSMLPLVMEGDIIICNKNTDRFNGKICAVTVDNESTLKRVKKDGTGVTLIPTNPIYRELHYTNKKAEELGFRIDGVLLQMIRNF